MENKPGPLKKDLQEKVSDLLNTFVKSVTNGDTKKIKKSIKQASKNVAKSVIKFLKGKPSVAAPKNTSALRKTSLRRSNRKLIVKPSAQSVSSVLKNNQPHLLKEILPKISAKKMPGTANHFKRDKTAKSLAE